MKPVRFTLRRHLPANTSGRDFVVSDLHGRRERFEQALDEVGFDPARDRVLSVGDLVDRGPDSLGTLALIEQPWFHAVLGNHELLLLDHLGLLGVRLAGRKGWAARTGAWATGLSPARRRRLHDLGERLLGLPLAISVDGALPFELTHADRDAVHAAERPSALAATPSRHGVDAATAERLTGSRAALAASRLARLSAFEYQGHAVRLSERPWSAARLCYVGHCPVSALTVHDGQVCIERRDLLGAHAEAGQSPTLLEHRSFALWLCGVCQARALALPGALACPLPCGA